GVSLMKDGEIAAPFSVSMPKYRLTEENKTTINQALLTTKAAIEAKL
ncbi:IclR family transcriptional regulator, partial [Enterococcus faecalis]